MTHSDLTYGSVGIYWQGTNGEVSYELPMTAKEGFTIQRESIWSANTTRNSDTNMTGTLLGYKWKLVLKWNALTQAQASVILNATGTGPGFKNILFWDEAGTPRTIAGYCGASSYTKYSVVNGKRYLKDVAVDIIER